MSRARVGMVADEELVVHEGAEEHIGLESVDLRDLVPRLHDGSRRERLGERHVRILGGLAFDLIVARMTHRMVDGKRESARDRRVGRVELARRARDERPRLVEILVADSPPTEKFIAPTFCVTAALTVRPPIVFAAGMAADTRI